MLGPFRRSLATLAAFLAVLLACALPAARCAAAVRGMPPAVAILCPRPDPYLFVPADTALTIYWYGSDPDGFFTTKPVMYKYRLLSAATPDYDMNQARSHPAAFRDYSIATAYAGWDSVGGDTTWMRYTGLTRGAEYLFVVTAFDESGDVDTLYSASSNMLLFESAYTFTLGPRLSISGRGINYTQPSGGWTTDPLAVVTHEVPAATPLEFDAGGVPSAGYEMQWYRWMLDGDPHDQTTRSDQSDLSHWSPKTNVGPYISLGPLASNGVKRGEHMLYLEGMAGCDSTGFRSLLPVRLVTVTPTFSHELLIVDDTRRELDQVHANGTPYTYTQPWPSAAELDTFLYARGGVPWRGTLNPPTGAVSKPGLFAGYSFDTLSTRGMTSGDSAGTGTVPVSSLTDYGHVIWIVDYPSATYTSAPTGILNPITALRRMDYRGREDVLSDYVSMGGKVWLVGGGTAMASLINFNATGAQNNDQKYASAGQTVFSNSANELVPGRILYDAAHVQNELVVAGQAAAGGIRALGRLAGSPGAYAALPASLQSKTTATDSLPPTRLGAQGNAAFFVNTHYAEFLSQPNYVQENVGPDPMAPVFESTLDSLYTVAGTSLPSTGYANVAMTVYHGPGSAPFVWSGFDIWSWRRSQCMALVDGVLQGVWGLTRENVDRGTAPSAARPAAGNPDAAPAGVSPPPDRSR